MSKILLFLALMFNTYLLLEARQFVIEGLHICPISHKSPLTLIDPKVSISKSNKLQGSGSIVIADELGKLDVIANADFKQCPTNNTCSGPTSIQLKDICTFLSAKSIFGNKLGDYFTPPIKCPVQPGSYSFNLTINMKPLAKFPLAKFRTYAKVVVSDKLPHERKRPLICFETIVSMKE